MGPRSDVLEDWGVSKSNVWVGGARVLLGLYSQIECIMGNGHIETPL